MRLKPTGLLLGGMLLSATPTFAADSDGNFAMKGAGFLPCQTFVDAREKKSDIYYLIGGWIDGYVSAHNRYSDDTYDALSFESLELLLLIIQTHCQSNPSDRLYSVLNSILIKINPDRVVAQSERVEITEGERKTVLYRETIGRMQAKLADLGLYKDHIDNRFTDATRSALIAFQSDNDLESTGFPDQTTLWRLFR
jgi:hypothetical protein